jgi:transcriptional coactivator p15 (PC4)
MSGGVSNILLFEQRQRGDLWRLQLCTYKGSTAIDWRKWYQDDEGEVRATKQGVRIPLERQPDLLAAIEACQLEKTSDARRSAVK